MLQSVSRQCWQLAGRAPVGQAGLVRAPAPRMHRRHACKAAHQVNGEQLEVEIANRDRHLIVDFYATWCGPCVLLATELEKAQEILGDEVKVLKVDTDKNPELSSMLKIEGLPTIVFIPKEADKPALRTEGLIPAAQLVQIVREL